MQTKNGNVQKMLKIAPFGSRIRPWVEFDLQNSKKTVWRQKKTQNEGKQAKQKSENFSKLIIPGINFEEKVF